MRSVLYYYPESVVLIRLYLDVDYYYLSWFVRIYSPHVQILFLSAQEFIKFCKYPVTVLLLNYPLPLFDIKHLV